MRLGNRAAKFVLILMTGGLAYLHGYSLYLTFQGTKPRKFSSEIYFLDLEGMKTKEETKESLETFLHGDRTKTFEDLKKELLSKKDRD